MSNDSENPTFSPSSSSVSAPNKNAAATEQSAFSNTQRSELTPARWPQLQRYGLQHAQLEQWQALDPAFQHHLARVVADYGQHYRVQTAVGPQQVTAPIAHQHTTMPRPTVGDWAVLKVHAEHWEWQAVLPRHSELRRNAAGRRTEAQLMAANVDQVWIVMGLDGDFNLARLERCLSAVWASGAQPRVVLSKADVARDPLAAWAQVMAVAPGVEVTLISALDGQGLEDIQAALQPGLSLALVGSSGAGKSTLCNALLGQALMRTQTVRAGDERGRHTTTHRELLVLPQGALLMDGPGIRELQLWADESALELTYAELHAQVQELARQCRFSDCQHQQEPGCAVQAALDCEQLSPQRWQRWQQLRAEVQAHQRRRDELARRAQERSQGKLYRQIQRAKRQQRGE